MDYEEKIGDLIYLYHLSPGELLAMPLSRIEWLYTLMVKTTKRFNKEAQKNGKGFEYQRNF